MLVQLHIVEPLERPLSAAVCTTQHSNWYIHHLQWDTVSR